MKTLINGLSKDFIIDHTSRVVKQKEDWRTPEWVDEKNGIAKFTTSVNNIIFYEDEYCEGVRTGKSQRIELAPKDIIALAEKIKEINSVCIEDIYVSDDEILSLVFV
jgi:hypothetical protein